ncbi:MAG: biotin/lipoyl-binding protein [Planctomycetota bacterium]
MFDMHALRLARTVGFLGALALVVRASGAEAQGRTASVIAERAELREITDTTPILGQVVATTESRVATRTAGIVTEVLFAVGDRVEAGQPLVRLDQANQLRALLRVARGDFLDERHPIRRVQGDRPLKQVEHRRHPRIRRRGLAHAIR